MQYNHNNDARFLEIMIALSEASGQETTALKERIYAQGLDDISISDIEQAAWSIIKTRTLSSFPKIGELREIIGGKTDDIADIEASKVWKAISSVGGYSSIVFDDAITQAVIQHAFGGWAKLCEETMVDQQKWFMKDFVKFYGSFSRQGLSVTGALVGRGGLSGDKPKLIGNPEKALQIMNTPYENSRFQISSIPENVRQMIGHTFKSEEESDG
ncbi:MAG: DUF6475 domain-containing protein [Bacteroidales bacterium]